MLHHRLTVRRGALALLAVAAVAAACAPPKQPPPPPLPALGFPCSASAGSPVSGNDPLRSGWYPDQPGLNPSVGGGCAFGQLWSAPVDGQVYAAPLVDTGVGANGTLFVVTENNNIYGLDAVTGAPLWSRNVGPAWNPADLSFACPNITPSIGITSTPAIDTTSHTAYFFSKTYSSGPPGPGQWNAHAIDLTNGAEKAGFPRNIEGFAANVPNVPSGTGVSFQPTTQLQRPGLLLMGGVVYAAFGSHCDVDPYRGWVVGVDEGTGAITTLWTDEALPPSVNASPRGGIWQSGGRLVSDKPGEILLTSGNGVLPSAPTPGKPVASPTLGESAIRLQVQADNSLQATDFWSPCNAQALTTADQDLGSGAPLVLPDSFGTSPHLVVIVGKQGPVYLLDRDNLGGFQQGSPNSCPDGSGQPGDAILNTASPPPNSPGVWATPAVWPGDGGLFYIASPSVFGLVGNFNAWRVVNSGGQPVLSLAGQSSDNFGYGASSAIITSDSTTSGSALVWVVFSPDGSGVNAELRAYDPVPVGGVLTLRGVWPIGTASNFNTPTVRNGRLYIGTRDGIVRSFGVTQAAAQSQQPPRSRVSSARQVPDREG